jgi:hypothetical protein
MGSHLETKESATGMDPATLIARLKAAGVKHELIADAIGRSRPVAVQIMHGNRPLKAHEMAPLERLLEGHDRGEHAESDRYVPVEVLPTYAGMGGGGMLDPHTRETALLPRALIEDTLRGRPFDFLVVPTRGDSMEPDFFQGDQVLIDRRDRNPTQPGPFALRVDDAFVMKNVEHVGRGLRVFSTNPKYSTEVVDPEQVEILGRPVWVGRML